MIIATHNGQFHADDVFAVASLELAGMVDEVVRTRDPTLLAAADMRVDVGDRYDPDSRDFDHHQPAGAGVRPNGIPYAAFGLIWKQFGIQLVGSPEAADLVDQRLVQITDAQDNGYPLFQAVASDVVPYSLDAMVARFRPSWQENPTDETMDQAFVEAVRWAGQVLVREIAAARDQLEAEAIVRVAIQEAQGQPIILLPRYLPWEDIVIKEATWAQFIIYPGQVAHVQDWCVRGIPVSIGSSESRRPLPEAWAGKRDAELVAISGVSDAIFLP